MKFMIGLGVFILAFISLIFNIRALGLLDIGIIAICLGFWNRKSLPGVLFYLILGAAGLAIFLGIFSFCVKLG
ncbi:MAG: hypothetical protein K6U80_08005 [Firmicutes bacterium]|nr:hypothetical protein [Bacillota bacterium]